MSRPFRRGTITSAALIAGGMALLLAPDASPAVEARPGLLWALALPAVATVLCRSHWLHGLAVVLLALAAEHLLFSPGIPRGHDLLAHSWGLWAFFQSMHDGDATPQWLHHLSLGLPLPLYYAPASYYLLTPFYWAGASVTQILKSAFVLHAVVGSLGLYFVARRWTGSSRAGLAAAAAYAFAPYRLLDAHYRMALGESTALALMPWLLGLIFDPGLWNRRRIAATALLTGLMILVHPLSALTTGVVALLWQCIEAWRLPPRETLRRFRARAVAASLGLTLVGCFVVPLGARLSSISLGRALNHPDSDELNYALQGLRPAQPFLRLPWPNIFRPEPLGSPRNVDGMEMPIYIGWGLALSTALAGGIACRRRQPSPLGEGETLAGPVAILASLSVGLSLMPAAALLAHAPLLPTLQFPWRFLGPATWAGAISVGFVARWLLQGNRRPVAAVPLAALLALLVVDGLPFTGAGQWVPNLPDAHPRALLRSYVEDADCGERWGCWKVEAMPEESPPMRVYGGFLPPREFGVDVSHVKPGFGEYLNGRALEQVLAALGDDDWARLGVGWIGDLNRPGIQRVEALAYARWFEAGSSDGKALSFRRRAGSIDVELPGQAGSFVVLEQYQPGWQVDFDRPLSADSQTAALPTGNGMMRVRVPFGARTAHMRFRVTGWDARVGGVMTLLALVTVFCLLRPAPSGRFGSGRWGIYSE